MSLTQIIITHGTATDLKQHDADIGTEIKLKALIFAEKKESSITLSIVIADKLALALV